METNYTYLAMLRGRTVEIKAPTALAAKQEAIRLLKPRKKDMGLLICELIARPDGTPVIHVATN